MKPKINSLHIIFIALLIIPTSGYCQEILSLSSVSPQVKQNKSGKSHALLKFELKALKRCVFGDLDALLLDIKRSDNSAELQLSIEPIPLTEQTALYAVANLDKRTKNSLGSFEVELPVTTEPQLYGVYLCSVPRSRRYPTPCSSQNLVDINDMLLPYRVDSSKAISPDGTLKAAPLTNHRKSKGLYKIYYFRFLLASKNRISVLSEALNDEGYIQLSKYLSTLLASPSETTKAVEEIKRYSKVLGSIPLKPNDGALQIPLPYYSRKKCLGVGTD